MVAVKRFDENRADRQDVWESSAIPVPSINSYSVGRLMPSSNAAAGSGGSEVLLHIDDSGLQIGTRVQALERVRKRLRKYVPESRNLSQELLDERREEAGREVEQ